MAASEGHTRTPTKILHLFIPRDLCALGNKSIKRQWIGGTIQLLRFKYRTSIH
jgi:hypothetical protein